VIELNVNGTLHRLDTLPYESLADVLHERLFLHGTRVTCAEGECGCCTVLVDGVPATACLMLAMQAEGHRITTIEGLGDSDHLHPIQQAFIDEFGFQCAFCTPGFIMSAKNLIDANPDPTREEVAEALSGNLCRCGSYPYIIEAVLTAAASLRRSADG
jgi:aerobic-type carbon monoxide dehydrogenase small subunit (CoxS/CutS family)